MPDEIDPQDISEQDLANANMSEVGGEGESETVDPIERVEGEEEPEEEEEEEEDEDEE
jgi:hypothetical protein